MSILLGQSRENETRNRAAAAVSFLLENTFWMPCHNFRNISRQIALRFRSVRLECLVMGSQQETHPAPVVNDLRKVVGAE